MIKKEVPYDLIKINFEHMNLYLRSSMNII